MWRWWRPEYIADRRWRWRWRWRIAIRPTYVPYLHTCIEYTGQWLPSRCRKMLSLTDRRGRVYIRQPLTCLPFPPIIHRLLKLRTVITLTSHCHNQSTIECPTLSLLSSLDGLPTLLNVETKLNSNRTATCQGSLRMTMSSSKSSAAVFAV